MTFRRNPAQRESGTPLGSSDPSFSLRGALSLLCLLGISSFTASAALAAEEQTSDQALDPVVVTAAPMSDPLTVVTDAKAPRQPVPAHDGADYLKTIPGFSVIRKGGTDGDPVFRGMAGSRLNILLDGEMIHGGCGGRMDPPTAYVYPESFDRITVLKGPQSVAWGPASAGTVLFERDFKPYTTPGFRFYGGAMFGSFGRNDQVIDAQAGNSSFYARLIGTHSRMNDYSDGNGQRVHSKYMRWSGGATLGLTPDETTRLELSATVSDGEAAYADRAMDGVKFARENFSLKFEKKKVSALVDKVNAQFYYNYIDHVMDNYSLRDQPGMKNVSNPDRLTTGLRLSGDLNLSDSALLKLGFDQQSNRHRFRGTTNYKNMDRVDDATFDNYGVFSEWTQLLSEKNRLVSGLRVDFWKAKDKRATGSTSGETRNKTLPGGFIRYEHDFGDTGSSSTFFAGLGHSKRFPDFWETISQNKESETSTSAFNTKPEKNTQLDIGTVYRVSPKLQLSTSAFYSRVSDYILIDNSRTLKKALLVRNIDATTYGGEAGVTYAWSRHLKSGLSLAYVRGRNRTDHTPLAQMPPLDSRLTLDYDDGTLSAGALWRLVSAQNRFDKDKGNIAGQDIGSTPGFGVFSINGGYRLRKDLRLTAGVDNLFNKTYAEAISKAGAMVAGYDQMTRINEPGRYFWLKLDLKFD